MQIITRRPDVGYLDTLLWVPKSKVNVEGIKMALTFTVVDRTSLSKFELWKETAHHLLLPREFWDAAEMDFPVIDCRVKKFQHVQITSRIKLDHLPDASDVLQPTGRTTQLEALQALLGARGGILQLACGKGKSIVALEYIARTCRPTIIVADNTQLLAQWQREVTKNLEVPGGVGLIQGQVFDWKKSIVLATYQTLAARADSFPEDARRWFGTVIWDECFPAGTLVDGRAIETLRAGDLVRSFNHDTGQIETRPVIRQFVSKPMALVLVILATGERVICTAGHPFYTQRGYVPASQLQQCDAVAKDMHHVEASAMRLVWDTRYAREEVAARQPKIWPSTLLLQRTREPIQSTCVLRHDDEDQQEIRVRTYVLKQPHAQAWRQRTSSGISQKEGLQTTPTWGQWETITITAKAFDESPWVGTRKGSYHQHHTWDGSINTLQDRPCTPHTPTSHRGGRTLTHHLETPSTRYQENNILAFTRVDSIEILQRGSTGEFGEVCPDNLVYNIEVEHNNNYFVNNILVHNCHHVAAPTFSKTADLFYGYRIGLSATPTREDGMQVVVDHHVGKVLYKDLKQELRPRIYFKWTGLALDKTDPVSRGLTEDKNGELHVGKIAGFLGQWPQRLHLILDLVTEALSEDRKVLVLSNSIDELVNLKALWDNQPLYTHIPFPNPSEIGETLVPIESDSATLEKANRNLWAYRGQTADPNLPSAKRQELGRRIKELEELFAQFEVWKKLDGIYRKRQRDYVKSLVEETSTAGLMIHQVPTKVRAQLMKEKEVVFAVSKYGREGLDSPDLDTIIAVEPMSSRNSLQQFMGRVLRKKVGKKSPVVVFLEDDIGPMIGMCQNLRRHLREWPVEEGGPYEYECVGHPTSVIKKGKQWTPNVKVFGR